MKKLSGGSRCKFLSVPLQTETPREQQIQQKSLDKESQPENNSPRKVLQQNEPSAMQTGSLLNSPTPMSNTSQAAKTTTKIDRTVKNATIENSSMQWALQIHVSDNTSYPLKYFLTSFGAPEKNLGLDRTRVMTIPSPSVTDFTSQYLLPFMTAENLEKAMKAGQSLSEGDQNITIQIWNPQGAAKPVPQVSSSQAAKKTVVQGTTSIFVKNISKNQKDRLQQIFSSVGPVSQVTPTSYRTAIVEFEKTDAAKKALQDKLPPPNNNLRCFKYTAKKWNKQHSEPTVHPSHQAATTPAQDTSTDVAAGNTVTNEQTQLPAALDNTPGPGGGGMDAVLPSEQPHTTTQFYIQSHWEKTANGTWNLDTKQLDEQLKAGGLV